MHPGGDLTILVLKYSSCSTHWRVCLSPKYTAKTLAGTLQARLALKSHRSANCSCTPHTECLHSPCLQYSKEIPVQGPSPSWIPVLSNCCKHSSHISSIKQLQPQSDTQLLFFPRLYLYWFLLFTLTRHQKISILSYAPRGHLHQGLLLEEEKSDASEIKWMLV